MTRRRRLDTELVRRGMAASRAEAQRLIDSGAVTVDGRPSAKPATMVDAGEPIIVESGPGWASRGAEKLVAALDAFDIPVDSRRALDVGASTGGFTDVLLRRGASAVVALDVGYGQLLWRLRTDPRVTVVDRTNFRSVSLDGLGAPFGIVTMDVSFISAASLAGRLAEAGAHGSDYVVLVKPQFEVGRRRVGRGGIVRDAGAHADAVSGVASALDAAGLGPLAAMASPILGGKGNREFLIHARSGAAGRPAADLVEAALA